MARKKRRSGRNEALIGWAWIAVVLLAGVRFVSLVHLHYFDYLETGTYASVGGRGNVITGERAVLSDLSGFVFGIVLFVWAAAMCSKLKSVRRALDWIAVVLLFVALGIGLLVGPILHYFRYLENGIYEAGAGLTGRSAMEVDMWNVASCVICIVCVCWGLSNSKLP